YRLIHLAHHLCLSLLISSFFFSCYDDHRDLHSFPTRRSSDLSDRQAGRGRAQSRGRRRHPAVETCLPGCRHWSLCRRVRGILRVDRKSTRLNSSHGSISYAVFCLKKKKKKKTKNLNVELIRKQ